MFSLSDSREKKIRRLKFVGLLGCRVEERVTTEERRCFSFCIFEGLPDEIEGEKLPPRPSYLLTPLARVPTFDAL
jgi:hypothetical protein